MNLQLLHYRVAVWVCAGQTLGKVRILTHDANRSRLCC